MPSWEILRSDGRYVGRSENKAPTIAFSTYMTVYGMAIKADEVEVKRLEDDSYRLSYRGDVYLLNTHSGDPDL